MADESKVDLQIDRDEACNVAFARIMRGRLRLCDDHLALAKHLFGLGWERGSGWAYERLASNISSDKREQRVQKTIQAAADIACKLRESDDAAASAAAECAVHDAEPVGVPAQLIESVFKRYRGRRACRMDADDPLPPPNIVPPQEGDRPSRWRPETVRGIICNPLYAGIAPYNGAVEDVMWVRAAAKAIAEDGAEQFLVNLLTILRMWSEAAEDYEEEDEGDD
jgi:hypothetical protein